MRTREKDKNIIKPYVKHVKITEANYEEIKRMNKYMVNKLNEGKAKKYHMKNQPLGRIISLLIMEHKTKTDYINIRKRNRKFIQHNIEGNNG
jgi:hypothetical protein